MKKLIAKKYTSDDFKKNIMVIKFNKEIKFVCLNSNKEINKFKLNNLNLKHKEEFYIDTINIKYIELAQQINNLYK